MAKALDPFPLVRPFLHRLDPERAHEVTLRALEANIVPPQPEVHDASLEVELFGRRLRNPIGLAAGFDKNARVYRRMFAQGFGFVEVGGVTPLPQRGNARPRVYRFPADRAIVNRMGFPNDGAAVVAARMATESAPGVVGVNLASNNESADPAEDFVSLVARFAPYADFLTLDISCPNTANGQTFLDPARLRDLLARIASVPLGSHAPAFVAKLSPDVDDAHLETLVGVLLDAKIGGFIVSNTTSTRPEHLAAAPAGGLSGPPLFARSTALIAQVASLAGGAVPIVGVGGVSSGPDAYAKIRAGATAVQLYTGLVYAGTALVTRIKRELAVLLLRDGYANVSEAVGADRRRGKALV